MKLNYLLISLACLFFNTFIQAQNHVCGLHDTEILMERLLKNKKQMQEFGIEKDGVINYVPVKYHIIRRDDGTGGQSVKNVLAMHCTLNTFFDDGDDGLQFYIKDGINIIHSTETYDDHPSNIGRNVFLDNKDNNAINIYIPADASPQQGPLDPASTSVVLGYYSPFRDWIVIRRADANGSSLTTPHELGHYFSLPHPFNGWENNPYDVAEHGETVGFFSPNGTPNELQDGSNCETAGDGICDTPPSYLFFGGSVCDYQGGARDPSGELVDPDELNIMDYFDDDCGENYFSPMQKGIMQEDYDDRNELQSNFNPSALSISDVPVIVEPLDDATTSGYDHVIFNWEPVDGADRYLLEVDRLPGFTLDPTVEVIFGTSADVFDAFEPDKAYFWRVTPFNAYYTCGPATDINKFTTGITLSADDVLEVDNLSIAPNPVSQDFVIVSLDTKDAFDAQISIVSAAGQTVQVNSRYFQAGQSNLELSVSNIPNGIYFMNITSADKLITRKLVVAK